MIVWKIRRKSDGKYRSISYARWTKDGKVYTRFGDVANQVRAIDKDSKRAYMRDDTSSYEVEVVEFELVEKSTTPGETYLKK